MMKKSILLFFLFISLTAFVRGQSLNNKYQGSLSVYHGETRLGNDVGLGIGPIETQIYIKWALWTLMGEPVYNVNAAVELRTHSLVVIKDDMSYTIPEEILFKIRPIDIKVLGVMESKTINVAGGKLGYTVKWDAGAPGKLYTPTVYQSSEAFEKLSKDEQKQYYSFNVAGSPNWDETFIDFKGFISKDKAIEFLKSGLDLSRKKSTRVEIKWDLTPIKSYINQQERLAFEKERAEVEKQKQQLAQKEQAKKQQEEEDFWNTAANTDTKEDVNAREAYNRAKKQLERKYDKKDSEQQDIDREKERYDQLLADKREELQNRPKPGETQGYFIDKRDGKRYKFVKIGEQVWMAENLNYYTSSGSWCYDDNSNNCDKYGRLYNWETAKEACPDGWHLPSKNEWTVLLLYIAQDGHYNAVGSALKATSGWKNKNGTDNYGFNALQSGMYYEYNNDKGYSNKGANWWTSTQLSSPVASCFYLSYTDDKLTEHSNFKIHRYSVRCVRNN